MKFKSLILVIVLMTVFFGCSMIQASPYASSVVSYNPGLFVDPNYINASVVLGSPAVKDSFDSPIVVDYASWEATDVLGLGNGGSVTIGFDHQVMNNPENVEYGTDLLVFGNSFFVSPWWLGDANVVSLESEPAKIEVSQDGANFYEIANVYADDLYPHTSSKGNFVHATPSGVSYMGRLPSDIETDYLDGCGGAQVDISDAIGTAPLDWIMYVRVTDIAGDSGLADIVGFADVVPEPMTMIIMLAGIGFIRKKR